MSLQNGIDDFDQIYKILEFNFPADERRSRAEQQALLQNEKYHIEALKSDIGIVTAFMAFWQFDTFIYLEHLAVADGFKGKGSGSLLVSSLTGRKMPVIAEIEPPAFSEKTMRRWRFYERLNFCYNDYKYMQPAYSANKEPVELKLISFPNALTQSVFDDVQKTLYCEVYRRS